MREHAFNCTVTLLQNFPGRRPDVRDTAALAEVEDLFGGKYLVDTAHYRFAPGELSGELELYRDIKG